MQMQHKSGAALIWRDILQCCVKGDYAEHGQLGAAA